MRHAVFTVRAAIRPSGSLQVKVPLKLLSKVRMAPADMESEQMGPTAVHGISAGETFASSPSTTYPWTDSLPFFDWDSPGASASETALSDAHCSGHPTH